MYNQILITANDLQVLLRGFLFTVVTGQDDAAGAHTGGKTGLDRFMIGDAPGIQAPYQAADLGRYDNASFFHHHVILDDVEDGIGSYQCYPVNVKKKEKLV